MVRLNEYLHALQEEAIVFSPSFVCERIISSFSNFKNIVKYYNDDFRCELWNLPCIGYLNK